MDSLDRPRLGDLRRPCPGLVGQRAERRTGQHDVVVAVAQAAAPHVALDVVHQAKVIQLSSKASVEPAARALVAISAGVSSEMPTPSAARRTKLRRAGAAVHCRRAKSRVVQTQMME